MMVEFPTWRNNTFESLFLVLMLQHSISKCILVLGHECSSITLMNKSRNIRHSSACLMINKTLVRKIQNLHSNCSMVCKFAFVSLCQSHLVSFLVKFHFSCWFFSYVAIRATSLNWPLCHGSRVHCFESKPMQSGTYFGSCLQNCFMIHVWPFFYDHNLLVSA